MKKKVLAVVMAATMIMGISLNASAATFSNVYLTTSQYSNYSGAVGDSSSVAVYALNNKSSKHNVKAITQASRAGGSYYTINTVSMGVGTVMSKKRLSGNPSDCSYRWQLIVVGVYKDCSAYGTIEL